MKSARDPRHIRRAKAVKELFASSFEKQKVGELAEKVFTLKDELDEEISGSAPQWPVNKLNKIDLAILRLAVYELFHTDTPSKVVVDEAVELAKTYGSESTPSFVNGVLGNVLKKHDELK